MAVHLKQTQFGYVCVQQEMPVKKEEEAWLLGKSLPLSRGSRGEAGDESAESSGPSRTRPASDQADNTTESGMLARLTAQGKPSEDPGGDEETVPGSRGEG